MGRSNSRIITNPVDSRNAILSRRASSGLQVWLVQRLSAIYLLFFLFYLTYFFVVNAPLNYQTWYTWVVMPFNRIIITVFFLAFIVHGWVGARDVILDYVKPLALKFTLLSVVILLCLSFGFWALFVINRVT